MTLPRFLFVLSAAFAALMTTAAAQQTERIDRPQEGTSLITSAKSTHESVPPAPAGLILDQAGVFQTETAARLSARLLAARATDVHVYVVTFRTLGVPPSKQQDKLHTIATDYMKAWASEKVGAILLFDDEGGLMSVDFSAETNRRFAGFAVEAAVKEPLGIIQESGLARDKLERSALFVADTLVPLQAKWMKDTRRQLIANVVMGTVALLGLGLALFSALCKPKTPASTAAQPSVEGSPPIDF